MSVNEPIDWNYPGLPIYVRTLQDWYASEQIRSYDEAILPDGKWRLFLGLLVFGKYVDRFLDLCMPSLLAPGNIPALTEPMVVIHTAEEDVEKIRVGVAPLAEKCHVEIRIIPPKLMTMVWENPANKYWLLGCAHNIHMQQAKYRAHAYHMLMPDHIYATGYFENLARLAETTDAIVQNNLSAQMEAVAPILKELNCAIPPEEMTKLALENIHPQERPYIINNRVDLPPSLRCVLIGSDRVEMFCPHMSIVYLSHDLLMKAPNRMPNTIDGQLPFFIPDKAKVITPSIDDGMVYMEVSDVDKPTYWEKEGSSLEEFCVKFWAVSYCEMGNVRFFDLTTTLPFPKDYIPKIKPLSEQEIYNFKRYVRGSVKDNYELVKNMLPIEYRGDPIERAKNGKQLIRTITIKFKE